MRLPTWIRQHLAAVRALLVLTVVTGVIYPLAIFAVGQVPGLKGNADGSEIKNAQGKVVGSKIIGQAYLDDKGEPLKQYFQSRPSAAGDGYDPLSTAASNLGPEDVVDTLPDPAIIKAGKEDENAKQSLLTQVCERSKDIGELEGADGSRPYCAKSRVGAVLAVFGSRTAEGNVTKPTRVVSLNEQCGVIDTPFLTTYRGVRVECAKFGEDYAKGLVVPVKGDAPADPKVPADAVTASASGLDPHISEDYAKLQIARVAKTRGKSPGEIRELVDDNTTSRALGFMGEPAVNVLKLNIALDKKYPFQG